MVGRVVRMLVVLVLVSLSSGCITQSSGITQVATIDALLAGGYEGHMSLQQLSRYGDFGIGTFEALDGEMILLDSKFYKVRADGKTSRPPLSEKTPFACVTPFVSDLRQFFTAPADMAAIETRIDSLVPQQNKFCAFMVRGEFSRVKARSVPAQQKPYPPLAEVTKTQPVFNLTKVQGTVVGFRCPPFVKGVNVPGYHMHFIADDLSGGGHVLDFELTRGTLDGDTTHEWLNVALPDASSSFDAADLTKDRAAELGTVEKDQKPSSAAMAGDGAVK